jgi:hypothetical protein
VCLLPEIIGYVLVTERVTQDNNVAVFVDILVLRDDLAVLDFPLIRLGLGWAGRVVHGGGLGAWAGTSNLGS